MHTRGGSVHTSTETKNITQDDARDSKAAAHELLDSFDFRPQAAGNASLQVTPGAKNGMACKLLMLLQQCSDACQHSQGATQVCFIPFVASIVLHAFTACALMKYHTAVFLLTFPP